MEWPSHVRRLCTLAFVTRSASPLSLLEIPSSSYLPGHHVQGAQETRVQQRDWSHLSLQLGQTPVGKYSSHLNRSPFHFWHTTSWCRRTVRGDVARTSDGPKGEKSGVLRLHV